MQNKNPAPAGPNWRPAFLLTGVFTALLGLLAIRLNLLDRFAYLAQGALLAGIALFILGLLMPSGWVWSLHQFLTSRLKLMSLPASIRLGLGLFILNIPLMALFAGIWWQARSPQPATPVVNATSTSPPTDYDQILDRAQLNGSYLPRVQYSMAQEDQSRNQPATDADQNQSSPAVQPAALLASWPAYLKAAQQQTLADYHLDAFNMSAPLDVTLHNTLHIDYESAGYDIEVLTWQATPGIYMPAVLYRPRGLTGRLPVVITPPACHEDVASHDDEANIQRRMANFALSGMLVFATEGFCANGIIQSVPGNERRFDYYTLASGSGISNVSLEIAAWSRALDYLATRPDTDMARVAITGYSNGASVTKNFVQVTDRVAAIAVVSSSLPETSNSYIYSDSRDNNNIFAKPSNFYNGAHMDSPFDDQSLFGAPSQDTPFLSPWTTAQLRLALSYGAPRPVYFVLGSHDSHYSILDAENAVAQMQQPWKDLGATVMPALDVVDAVHGYNAEHLSLVRAWFIKVLNTTPLLPPPTGFEYETPLLKKEQLEVTPTQYPGITLHDLYSGLALKTIAARQKDAPLTALSHIEAIDQVKSLLGMPQVSPRSVPRPILLDDTALPFQGKQIRFQYWLVGSDSYLRSGLLVLYDEHAVDSLGSIDLHISTSELLPSESDLQAALAKNELVAVLIAPGYGVLSSSQSTTGNFARQQAQHFTLTGMGVSIIERGLDLLQTQWPGVPVNLYAQGVDAGNIAYFAAALDIRINSVWVTHGLATFDSLLTAPSQPYVPPTLVIPGVLASVTVDDLRWLAAPREIHLVSESDLSEFHPDKP